MILLWVASAWAGLRVEDPSGCLDREALALEVDQVLTVAGAQAATVRVARDGEGTVAVEVVDEGVTRWARQLPLADGDCGVGHLLVARSVEQGLAALPDWSWRHDDGRRAPDASVAVGVGVAPVDRPLSWGALARIGGPLGGRTRWVAGLGMQGTTLRDMGRGAQLLAVHARVGPAVDLGRHAGWRVGAAVAAGPVFVAPQVPLQLAGPSVVPGMRGELSVARVGEGWLWLEAWVDSPVLRLQIRDETTGATLREGVVRGGLRVGARGDLRTR